MMELLRAWLTGVTAAAILCALADSLMPPGPVRKAGKLAGGLVMLAAILRPLVQIQASDPARWLEAARPEGTAQVQALEEERDEAVKALIHILWTRRRPWGRSAPPRWSVSRRGTECFFPGAR